MHVFFWKLEREVKLANRLQDQSDHSILVQAVRRGIPLGYGTAITNIGFAILCNYPEWKQWVLLMYDERQKQKVFEQTQGIERHPEKWARLNQKAPSVGPTIGPATVSKPKHPTEDKA